MDGDLVTTDAAAGTQYYWQYQDTTSTYDYYFYGSDGSQQWSQDVVKADEGAWSDGKGDKWYWDEPDYTWCYYFADTETWACVNDDGIGCLITPLQNRVCYNKYNDEWLYADYEHFSSSFDDFQFYYYPEWAWGSSDQEWYLWDDLHDAWVVAAS